MRELAVGVLCAIAASAPVLLAGDEKSKGVAPAADIQEKSADNPKSKRKRSADRRLPALYGKVGLSEEQKEKIYAAQKGVRAKLDPIEEEIERLREEIRAKQAEQAKVKQELDARMREVLTESQRKELDVFVAEAKARAELKKKRSGAATPPAKATVPEKK